MSASKVGTEAGDGDGPQVTAGEFLLAFFSESDRVRIRAIPPDRKGRATIQVVTPGQVAHATSVQNRLRKLNERCGIYFVVNSGGDKDADISRFNATFCESDDLSLAEQHAQLNHSPLAPSIRVETKKSVHAYWLINGQCSEKEWRGIQLGLIHRFRGDPSIKNPSRTMRLPGFNHVSSADNGKLQYKRVRVVDFHPDRRYTPAQLRDAFPKPPKLEADRTTGRENKIAFGKVLAEGVRNATMTSLAGTMQRRGMSEEAILAALRAENSSRCKPPLDDLELRAIAESVAKYPPKVSLDDDPVSALRALSEESTVPEVTAALRKMAESLENAHADRLTRQATREEAISLLKGCGSLSSPAKLVDAAMPVDEVIPRSGPGNLFLVDPDPWPEAVNGVALLDEITETINRFVRASPEFVATVALWIVYSHAFDSFDCLPLLLITSPEKRCGKTTLIGVIAALVPRPLPTSNATAAVLYRGIEKYRPTLLIDEADTFLGGDRNDDSKELRGIINSGHSRLSASVLRAVPAGDDYDVRAFSTWAPKVIAMIGEPADTILDRSVRARLERKGVAERTEHFRMDRLHQLEPIRSRVARWARDNADRLRSADPNIPDGITNSRMRDNWRVLLSVADALGGEWPQRARDIAVLAAGRAPVSESPTATLLADMRAMFDELGDQVESAKVIEYLIALEERPWGDWRQGKPLTTHGLARLLKRFGIKPDKWRAGNDTVRGYQLKDFQDTFGRYVPTEERPPAMVDVTDSPQSPQGR